MEKIWLLVGFLVLLASAGFYLGIAKSREHQNRYLDYRALAEGLRVLLFWRMAGLGHSVSDDYLDKQAGELEWIRWAIRANPVAPMEREALQQTYPVIRKQWLEDQAGYFLKAAARQHHREHRLEWVAGAFFGLSLALSIVLLGYHLFEFEVLLLHHLLIVGIGLSIAVSAFTHAYVEKAAYSEVAKQFARMTQIFHSGLADCDKAHREQDLPRLARILGNLGAESLQENGDWVLLHRARPLELPKG